MKGPDHGLLLAIHRWSLTVDAQHTMREFDPKYPEGIDAEFNELERERQEWEDIRAQERDIESRLERERERREECEDGGKP